MSAYAADLSGRRVYPEWSFSFAILHRRGTPGTSLKGIHCDRCPSSPSGMCGTLPIPRQIGLPQDQVHIHCPSSLGGTCILPLSALILQCGGTSHAILPTSGEFQDPTRGIHPGRVPDPPASLIPKWRSLFLQLSPEPPGFSAYNFHNIVLRGSSN